MSRDDGAPDSIDKAYAEAEAALADDRARAARRARVLDAVAHDDDGPQESPVPPMRRPAWRRGGWLVAASVAGLSAIVATSINQPTPLSPPQASPNASAPAAAPAAAKTESAPVASAVSPPARKPPSAPAPLAPSLPAETAASPERPPSAPPPMAAAPAALDAPAAAAGPAPKAQRSGDIAEIVVSAERRASPPAPSADPSAKLRDAAAAGKTEDIAAALAKSVPVDAVDVEGDTALMKAVRADKPAAAALLLRRGANLDRKNHAGASARDMAKAIGDPDLNRALGLP